MPDENVLDFAIDTGEFYQNQLASVIDQKEVPLNPRTFMTFITVDFYNHDTETSQFSEGFAPNYATQFAFRNRIDDFYIRQLLKSWVKLDVFVSKAQAAEHIGTCKILLRDLIDQEEVTAAAGYRTKSISSMVNIQSLRDENLVIGVLRFKMKMRKSISEALKWFREKEELSAISTSIRAGLEKADEVKMQKKIVTIEIGQGFGLSTRYSGVTNIRPFFYFQFYTFDEYYSRVYDGPNPNFGEMKSYDIMYNQRFIQYCNKEVLEIHLFDDSGPIADVAKGSMGPSLDQSGADDFIGTVRIPLKELSAMSNVYDRFGVYNNANQKVGELEIKMSIMDGGIDSYGAAGLGVSRQWENDIMR